MRSTTLSLLETRTGRAVAGGLLIFLGIILVRAFHQAGVFYFSYAMPYEQGFSHVHSQELAVLVVFSLYGLAASVLFSLGLTLWGLSTWLERVAAYLVRRPTALVGGGVLLLLAAMMMAWLEVFQGAPITDDEPTYLFMARTLLEGRVINPLPGDEAFFRNFFIVFTDSGWFGKYPIGHSLVLALGEATGTTAAVTPLLSALTVVLTWFVGARLFGRSVAGIGVIFLLLSPQFVLTGTTLLSQPTSTFFMMLGLLLTLRFEESPTATRAALASTAWSFGVLVRPLPGLLFILIVGAWLFSRLFRDRLITGSARAVVLAAAALPAAAFAALFFAVNHLQSGGALMTGYELSSGRLGLGSPGDSAVFTFSLLGGWFRQNIWLFGWPISYLFVPFARGRRSIALLWGLLAALCIYRLIVPKTFVSTTGPVYLAEAVPLLALATASGVFRVRDWLTTHGYTRLRAALAPTLVALFAVSLSMFLPVQLRNIETSCATWMTPYYLLENHTKERKALVFANRMVTHQWVSWSMFPPPPSPTLDDDVIFVRIPAGTEDPGPLVDFWRRRFPDRSAWLFDPQVTDGPPLRPLIPQR